MNAGPLRLCSKEEIVQAVAYILTKDGGVACLTNTANCPWKVTSTELKRREVGAPVIT